jgi:hypothetical protein
MAKVLIPVACRLRLMRALLDAPCEGSERGKSHIHRKISKPLWSKVKGA